MKESIIDSKKDDEVLFCINKATSLADLCRRLGYKISDKGIGKKTKDKIKERCIKLGITNLQEIFKNNLSNNIKTEDIKTVDCSNLDKNGIGRLGESIFVTMCSRHDIKVSKPLYDNYTYDYIIDYKGKLYKVQVKSSSQYDPTTGVTEFGLQRITNNGQYNSINYQSGDYDLLFLYSAVLDEGYLLKFINQSSIQIRKTQTRNNQKKKIIYADDVLFENVIKTL